TGVATTSGCTHLHRCRTRPHLLHPGGAGTGRGGPPGHRPGALRHALPRRRVAPAGRGRPVAVATEPADRPVPGALPGQPAPQVHAALGASASRPAARPGHPTAPPPQSAQVATPRPAGPQPARPGRAATHTQTTRHRVRVRSLPAQHPVDDGVASWLAQVRRPQVVAVHEDLAVAVAADLPEPAFQRGGPRGAQVAVAQRPPQTAAAVLEHPVDVAEQTLPRPRVGQLAGQLTQVGLGVLDRQVRHLRSEPAGTDTAQPSQRPSPAAARLASSIVTAWAAARAAARAPSRNAIVTASRLAVEKEVYPPSIPVPSTVTSASSPAWSRARATSSPSRNDPVRFTTISPSGTGWSRQRASAPATTNRSIAPTPPASATASTITAPPPRPARAPTIGPAAARERLPPRRRARSQR